MKSYLKFAALAAFAFTVVFTGISPQTASADDAQYSFKVHNTTKDKITKLLASEDGKNYGNFDIGSGIAAGATVTLEWDKKTNDKGCKWWFKAVFDGDEESEAKRFDFCEEDLELEF